jgi:hypothetical protein
LYLRKKVVIKTGSQRPIVAPKPEVEDEDLPDSDGDTVVSNLEVTEPKGRNTNKKNLKR